MEALNRFVCRRRRLQPVRPWVVACRPVLTARAPLPEVAVGVVEADGFTVAGFTAVGRGGEALLPVIAVIDGTASTAPVEAKGVLAAGNLCIDRVGVVLLKHRLSLHVDDMLEDVAGRIVTPRLRQCASDGGSQVAVGGPSVLGKRAVVVRGADLDRLPLVIVAVNNAGYRAAVRQINLHDFTQGVVMISHTGVHRGCARNHHARRNDPAQAIVLPGFGNGAVAQAGIGCRCRVVRHDFGQ